MLQKRKEWRWWRWSCRAAEWEKWNDVQAAFSSFFPLHSDFIAPRLCQFSIKDLLQCVTFVFILCFLHWMHFDNMLTYVYIFRWCFFRKSVLMEGESKVELPTRRNLPFSFLSLQYYQLQLYAIACWVFFNCIWNLLNKLDDQICGWKMAVCTHKRWILSSLKNPNCLSGFFSSL